MTRRRRAPTRVRTRARRTRADAPVGTVLDPRLLRHFLGVAEELHFGRAARRLHVAQQPLSQAIGRLEADLGARPFERTSRRVALTAAGRAFLADARALARRSADAVEAARRAARGEAGALAAGYGSGELHSVLPDLVRRFRASHPAVALRPVELGAADIVAGWPVAYRSRRSCAAAAAASMRNHISANRPSRTR